MINPDVRQMISEADLMYDKPASRPVEGHPIGNGRMGTMVWTGPGSVEFQINRVDVFAVNRNHQGARGGPADYCGGCARVSIDVGGDAFRAREGFAQRLSLHKAEDVIEGDGVRARCFVASGRDVLVLEIEDRRPEPRALRVDVAMWRDPVVVNGAHTARYEFREKPETVLLVQRFTDTGYYCGSAVGVQVTGTAAVHAPSDRCRSLGIPAARGKRLFLISSAASWDTGADVAGAATAILNQCAGSAYDELRAAHVLWWAELWLRTFVRLRSTDGKAEQIEHLRNRQLYYMASSSRGALPPKWNGSIFAVDGDARSWGAQFWVWTTEISYFPLFAADAVELTDSFFDMYVRQIPAAKEAARQRWNAHGAYFLEAGPFDGPVVLPDDVAREYQDVYLGRKTICELSPAARNLGQYECVLTQFADGNSFRGEAGRYSYVSHIVSSGSEVAAQAWWRYRYTGDTAWLRTHAYPLLRETVELYRSLARKDDDGCYHLKGLNQHEGYWGVNDGLTDLAAIRGTVPLAIQAAKILGVDESLRQTWCEFLDRLTPYPMGGDEETIPVGKVAPDVWAIGHRGPSRHWQSNPGCAEGLLWPVFPFEDWTLETRDPTIEKIAQKAGELNAYRTELLAGQNSFANSAIRTPIQGSRLGRGSELPAILANYYHAYKPLLNGFSLFEGATDQSIEHLGCISMALQEALLQSVAPRPGEPEVISVFPAWPQEWDAEFRLLARGGFLVTASRVSGKTDFVEIHSRRGEPCRFRNCWGVPCLLSESGGKARQLDGDILIFNTKPGKTYRIEVWRLIP